MLSEDNDVDTQYNSEIMSKMVAVNRFSKDKSFEENMDEFYDIFIAEDGSELFACKYHNCPNIEKQESDIISHLRQHFSDVVEPNVVDINLSDNSGETLKIVKKEIDNEVDNEVECINISDDNTVESEADSKQTNKNNAEINATNDWEQYVGQGFGDGKESLFLCTYSSDCRFSTNLRMKIKNHINKHFESTKSVKTEFNEYQYWEQCLNNAFSTQKATNSRSKTPPREVTPVRAHSSKKYCKSKSKSGSKVKTQTKKGNSTVTAPHNDLLNGVDSTPIPDTSGLIDINFNHNNTILSLKGMASVKKLEKYIECQVIDGHKYFCCNYLIANGKCEFKSRRSQETANHVHCAHLGFFLECVRPDCDKIFRTPGSWREHQKNHICNFGLYGYQRGVTGKCRNSYLLQFQDKIIIEGDHKAYKCNWKGCGFVTRQRTACKRHIHNTHVCPYRKNKIWKKELLKFMELKSYLTEKPIPIKNEKFFCSRSHCNAELANESDLRRHEKHFCKYKPSVKTVRNGQKGRSLPTEEIQKPRAVARLVFSPPMPSTSGLNVSERSQDSNQKKNSETKRQIKENGHTFISPKRSNNTNNTNQNEVQQQPIDPIRAKCERFIERKPYDGITFILCTAPNCKFTTKVEDKIYDHIKRMHSLESRKPSASSTSTSMEREGTPQLRKRSHSSLDSSDTIVSKASKSSSVNSQTNYIPKGGQKRIRNSSQKIPQNLRQNSNNEISSEKRPKLVPNLGQTSSDSDLKHKFKNYFKVKRIDNEPFYFCEYPSSQCRFYSKTEKELYDHISQTHIVFKCNLSNCNREFKSEGLLEVHKRNHICGFGISGMKATGVCALDNVRRYRREIQVNGRYLYECKVCKYTNDNKSTVLSHAHNRHIHPQPPPQ